MKLITIFTFFITNVAFAQNYHIGNLTVDLVKMTFWNDSRVSLHLEMNNIPFKVETNYKQKHIIVADKFFEIAFHFNNNESSSITYRFSNNKEGQLFKSVFYSYLDGVCAKNAYGDWLYGQESSLVLIRYKTEMNGFIIWHE